VVLGTANTALILTSSHRRLVAPLLVAAAAIWRSW